MTRQGPVKGRRSRLPPRSQRQHSTGDWEDRVADQPFKEAADRPEAAEGTVEEMAEEASLTGDHRRTRMRQEEYREMHRPYPTPPINSSAYHRKCLPGDRTKTEDFLLQWRTYCGANRNNSTLAVPFTKAMIFLTFLQGDLVKTWVLSAMN